MVQRFTFPQSGDADDAEHFGAMIGHDNMANFVADGINLTPDYAVPELSVTQGKAFIQIPSDTASSSGEEILKVNRVVQIPSQTVSLTDGTTNYVYLEPDLSTDDNGGVSAYTSTQSGNALLLATIDTTNDTMAEENRFPSGQFSDINTDSMTVNDSLNLPSGALDASDVPFGEGLESDGSGSFRVDEDHPFYFTADINHGGNVNLDGDGLKAQWGANQDFSIFYENAADELVIRDEVNGVDLIRQPKVGSTQFLQGIDAGSIEAPEDSFTQLANASVTSGLTAGDRVGYTLALDNQTFFAIDGEADGAGGIQNTVVDIPNSNLSIGGKTIINTTTDGKLELVASDVGTTAGTPEPGWNYMEFLDGQRDRQGFLGISPDGNFRFSTGIPGGKLEATIDGAVYELWTEENDEPLRTRQAQIPLTTIPAGNNAVGLKLGVPSGKTLKVYEAGLSDDSNSVPTGLDVVVYDDSNSVDIYRSNSFHTEGTPLASKDGLYNVEIRLENATGAEVNASGYVLYTME